MLKRKPPAQLELFVAGSLEQLVPDDHILARVDRVLDLGWLHDEVADCYCAHSGRPGIDPEMAVRLMLAGFLLGIVHDRRLMREAQVNIAIRWFIGCGLHERLPDHSSPARIRQRWGDARFRRIFERTASACVEAGIAQGEVVHVDATLVRADAGWESMVDRHAGAVAAENGDAEEDAAPPGGKRKKVSVTDPDASLATSSRGRRLEPSYKQHTAVDDGSGVVPDVTVTTGEVNERNVIEDQVDEVRRISGKKIETVTADAGYAYGKACGGLERRGIDPVIPAKREPTRSRVPACRFRYDERNNIVKCPRGKALRPGQPFKDGQMRFHARTRDCAGCPPGGDCVPGSRNRKTVVISADHPALLRARRRRLRWSEEDRRPCRRHRWRSEGFHGEAKTWHGLGRAVRRGLGNMRIQSYLTAAAINLKRLAAAFCARFPAIGTIRMRGTPLSVLLARQAGPGRRMPARVARLRAARPRSDRHRNTPRNLWKAA